MKEHIKEGLREGLNGILLVLIYIPIILIILFIVYKFIPKEEPKTLEEEFGYVCSDEYVFNNNTFELCQQAIDSKASEEEEQYYLENLRY
jgi:NADH:ubiquinone oxidoreductase subunit 3 (subunit A)